MAYEPARRKRNRWENFNYSTYQNYFVTLCTKNNDNFFGVIENERMKLSGIGRVTDQHWRAISSHFKNIRISDFIIMPNHIHGIITVSNDREPLANQPEEERRISRPPSPEKRNHQRLPVIIGSFKAGVTREVNTAFPDTGFAWQKSYYDKIIRNNEELLPIKKYIHENPKNLNAPD